jgi:hypothetical protein
MDQTCISVVQGSEFSGSAFVLGFWVPRFRFSGANLEPVSNPELRTKNEP